MSFLNSGHTFDWQIHTNTQWSWIASVRVFILLRPGLVVTWVGNIVKRVVFWQLQGFELQLHKSIVVGFFVGFNQT